MRATDADVRPTSNGPGRPGAVDYSAVGREEEGEVGAHAEDLSRGTHELVDGGNAVVREIVVVGQSVEAGAFAACIAGAGCRELKVSAGCTRTLADIVTYRMSASHVDEL